MGENAAAIILIWIGVALTLAVLLWPKGKGRRFARQMYALASLSFREGLRFKILWMVFGLAFIPGILAFFSDADGTHAGRAKLILNTCLGAGEVLGAGLIILLAALSLAREIESRVMHTLGTKPVPRWGILLGKALGIWAVDLVFLLGLTLFAAVLVRCVPMRLETREPSKLVQTGTWEDLRRNALTTRTYFSGTIDEGSTAKLKFIKPGTSGTWQFQIDSEQFRGEAAALKLQLASSYSFVSFIEGVHLTVAQGNDKLFDQTFNAPRERPFEIFLDSSKLRSGPLEVTIEAQKNKYQLSIIAQKATGVRIGSYHDGLASNLAKAFALMAVQGWILAAILTGWSGVLSFPITVAFGVILVLGGELSRHVLELLQVSANRAEVLSAAEIQVSNSTSLLADQIRNILQLLPDFQTAGGPTAFVDGKILSALAIANAVLYMALLRGIGWAIPGAVLFQRREVGK